MAAVRKWCFNGKGVGKTVSAFFLRWLDKTILLLSDCYTATHFLKTS